MKSFMVNESGERETERNWSKFKEDDVKRQEVIAPQLFCADV